MSSLRTCSLLRGHRFPTMTRLGRLGLSQRSLSNHRLGQRSYLENEVGKWVERAVAHITCSCLDCLDPTVFFSKCNDVQIMIMAPAIFQALAASTSIASSHLAELMFILEVLMPRARDHVLDLIAYDLRKETMLRTAGIVRPSKLRNTHTTRSHMIACERRHALQNKWDQSCAMALIVEGCQLV